MIKVYLISAQIGDEKLYKIGHTRRTVEQRIKEFRTGNASEFNICSVFESKWGTKIESHLHRRLKEKKVNGEWFSLDDNDVKNFINECKKIDNNLTVISKGTYYMERGKF